MSGLCVLCGFDLTPVELATCQPCVGLVRLDLMQVEHCYALLPGLLGRPDGASLGAVMGGLSGEAGLPGSDAMVMLGPGAEHGEGDPSDPPAVAFELWQWAVDWAEIRGEESSHDQQWERHLGLSGRMDPLVPSVAALGASNGHSVPGLVAYLGKRLGWAGSHHPAFDCFAADMARIRGRLEVVTATDDAPERGETCPYDGATLTRRYLATGREDDWSCHRCHRVFSEAQYRLAVAMALRGA